MSNNASNAIITQFLKEYENKIVDLTISSTKTYGLGAIFINLINTSDELDIEYYKVEDLCEEYKKRIYENPKVDTTIYYIIRLNNESYIFEKNIEEGLN